MNHLVAIASRVYDLTGLDLGHGRKISRRFLVRIIDATQIQVWGRMWGRKAPAITKARYAYGFAGVLVEPGGTALVSQAVA